MSIHDRDLLTGKTKLETSIERIRTFCTGKKTLVAFSGGKDSQCCYHLCEDAGIGFVVQYSTITRFDPPDLIAFIREHYRDVTFRRAYEKSLVEQIADNGLPNRWFRWCCDAKHRKTLGFDISVIGVRAAESPRQAANWRTFGRKKDGSWYVCPIFDWTDADVWEYLNGKGLPHCSLYDEGDGKISNEKQETVADIVAQIRAVAYIQTSDSPESVLRLADRIEAAHFRECEALREERNRAALTEREKLVPRIRELEAENARLRAALKPVLECKVLSAMTAEIRPGESDYCSNIIFNAQRIYNEDK